MRVEDLERDILLFEGEDYRSNATLFLSPEGGLLVDGLGSRADAAALGEHLSRLNVPVRLFVLTHAFSDHLAALTYFSEAPIVAHERAKETHLMEEHLTEEETSFYRKPSLLVRDGIAIDWGRHRLDVSHRPGNTPSSLMVDVPSADLLIAGDAAVGNMAYVKYAQLAALRDSLEWAKSRGRRRVVQGHGGVRSVDCFDHALHYLSTMQRWARGDRARTPKLRDCLPDGVSDSDFEDIFHRRNVDLILRGALSL